MPLRMAVIGVGHLGKEHARILAGLPDVELVGVADVNVAQAQSVAQKLGTQAFADYWPLLNLVDAATIVVPTFQHASVASEFLKRGIPLLVEKPLASTLHEADTLVNLAEKFRAVLQVGHIERFNPAYQEIKRRPMQPRFIRAERMGSFTGRSTDIGVVLDLMIHDLDLLLDLVQSPVETVEAVGVSVFGGREDVANVRLRFSNGCVADVTASRANPTPRRTMQIWAPEGYASLDFAQRKVTLIQPSPELRQNGLDPAKLDPASRARLKDELFSRHLQTLTLDGQAQDQLTAELTHFVHCVKTKSQPLVSGLEARNALAVAQRILNSLRHHDWNGKNSDCIGPNHLPFPVGPLFPREERKEVA
jgi:predicted dehydrogenase